MDSKHFLSKIYLENLFRSYNSNKLHYYWEIVKKPLDDLETYYINTDFRFIDDFSLLTEFSYIVGPYSFELGHVGNATTFVIHMEEQDYYNLFFN